MTLKSNWSIASDDENSRQSFLSDCDSEFDLSPPPRYPAEKRSISALNKLSINRNEPPLTRSRAKATGKPMIIPQLVPKERRRSTVVRRSIDSFTGMATTFTNSILFPKQELSNKRCPNSPTDGVNTLADWFESCSLDEGKFGKNCFWPSRETNSHYMRPITTSSPHVTFGSNPFYESQSSPLFVQSSSTTTTTLFGQQPAQLWSRFRFAASTIRNNLWVEQLNSTPSNIFTSSNNRFSNQSPMLSSTSNVLSSSSPPQIVPSLLPKTSPSPIQDLSFPLLRQRQTTNSEVLSRKEDAIIPPSSSSKIFFTLIIFAVGLVLGYLLTNTFPPDLIRHWFLIIWETSVQISIKYFHLFYAYFQIVMKYFSSFIY